MRGGRRARPHRRSRRTARLRGRATFRPCPRTRTSPRPRVAGRRAALARILNFPHFLPVDGFTRPSSASTLAAASSMASCTGRDSSPPTVRSSATSIPTTTTRAGSRPRARPSSSASARPRPCVDALPVRAGSGSRARVEVVDGPRLPARAHRVDDDDRAELVPGVEELGRLTAELDQAHGGGNPAGEPPHHLDAGAVVGAQRVADGDDRRRTVSHDRPARSRKCVAHEMHGS